MGISLRFGKYSLYARAIYLLCARQWNASGSRNNCLLRYQLQYLTSWWLGLEVEWHPTRSESLSTASP
jgi:hypothetical protein